MPPKSVFKPVFRIGLLFFVLLTVVRFGGTALWAQGKILVRKELPAGKYMMEQDIHYSQSVMMGRNSSIGRQKAQLFWGLEISGPTDRREAVLKLRDIAFTMRTNSGEERSFGYDSSQGVSVSTELKEIFDRILDLTVMVKFDGNLNPVSVTGADAIISYLEKEASGADESNLLIISVLRNLLSPEMIMGYFNQLYYLRPSEPVAVGDSWTGETHLAIPERKDVLIQWESRLDHVQDVSGDQIAEISGTGTIMVDDITEVKCDVESKFRVKSGLPFSVAFQAVDSRTDKFTVAEKEESIKTIRLFRTAQTITPL